MRYLILDDAIRTMMTRRTIIVSLFPYVAVLFPPSGGGSPPNRIFGFLGRGSFPTLPFLFISFSFSFPFLFSIFGECHVQYSPPLGGGGDLFLPPPPLSFEKTMPTTWIVSTIIPDPSTSFFSLLHSLLLVVQIF